MATRIIIESQKRGLKIAFRDVFAHPTPRALAALESNSDTASGSDSISDSNSDSGSSHASDSAEPNASLDVVSSFDYAKIDQLLQTNTVKAFVQEPSLPIGTILLTGATGFLGIHLLASFLEHETGTVYCLVRPQHGRSGEARLKTMLFYYFDDRYIDEIGRRIHVLHGDVTDATSLDAIDVDIDTVFNCAANVKHFSQQDDIDRVNRIGAENIVAFCRQRGCRLVHVSTTSVAGTLPPGKNLIESTLTEQTLYFGQNMDNQYVQSKFLGERAVLSAATEGLSAKIIRVGNLSARISDGEFQANFVSNSFVGRLNALTMIGKVPYSFAATPTEFSPIDTVSEAILKLATTPESCRVFHAFNPYPVYYSDIVLMLNNCDSSLEFVDEEEFRQVMSQAASDPEKAKSLVGFVAYHSADNKMPVLCPKSCQYTIQILLRLGWKWPIIPPTYMRQFIDNLIGLGFFQGQKTME